MREVEIVKRTQHGVIPDPYSIRPDATLAEAAAADGSARASARSSSSTSDGRLEGLLTERDMRFVDEADRRGAPSG